jgi:hypothetical protein
MIKWKYFIGSCILAAGLLFKAGAPIPAVAIGIAAVAFLNWRRQKHRTS